MNKKSLRKIINLLNILMICCILYSILALIFFWRLKTYDVLFQLPLFLLIPIVLYACHVLFDNMFLFTIIHLACAAAVYFVLLPYKFSLIVLGIFTVICIIYSFYKKFDIVLPKPTELGLLPSVLLIISYITSLFLKNKAVSSLITFSFICYVFFYILSHYLTNVFNFYDSTACTSIGSFEKARIILNKIIFGFSGFSVIVMVVFSLLPNSEFPKDLKTFWGFLASKINALIKRFSNRSSSDHSISDVTDSPLETINSTATAVASKTSENTGIVQYIILGVLIVIFLLGLFVLIRALFSSISKTNAPIQNDVTNFIVPFESEKKYETNKKGLKRIVDMFGQSPEQKIRKIFFKTIIDNVDERLISNNSFTATQLCDLTYEEMDKESLYAMRDIYEKARYGDNSCTLKDVSDMRELQKKCKIEYQNNYTYKRG